MIRLCALLLFAGCAAPAADGIDASLRVEGGQYIAGPMPAESGGPAILQAAPTRDTILPGLLKRTLHGSISLDANAVAIGLAGDPGYWVIPAGPPDVQQPGALTLDATLSFSPRLPPGDSQLILQAISADGRAGPRNEYPLTDPSDTQTYSLAFVLSWDDEADLDLHVLNPDGTEIYWNHLQGGGGALDFDSNANCQGDGLRKERVLWTAAPPAGHYTARVDTRSLCGAPAAHWTLEAIKGAQAIARARGESIPFDTRGDHGRGAGVTALELDL